MRYLVVFLAIYFLAGGVSVYVNYWLVKERKSIIEKFHKLRLTAFQNDLGVQIELSSDVYEIGFDADKARNVVSDYEFKRYMSDDGLSALVATAVFFVSFLNTRWLLRDWQCLNKLRKSYKQAEDVVGSLI